MALESVVFQQDPFCYGVVGLEGNDQITPSVVGFDPSDNYYDVKDEFDTNYYTSSQDNYARGGRIPAVETPVATGDHRRKRRRIRSVKNEEEVEQQRMTHITVERNRRKQMNDYLAVLRSMMPASYAPRGDQASIIGGAINYVKELEKLLQSLEAHKRILIKNQFSDTYNNNLPSPFSHLFSFPQYSTNGTEQNKKSLLHNYNQTSLMSKKTSGIADVEVTMAENHANVRIQSKRQPRQLLKMVAGFYSLCLSILHINVTTVEHMVLYTFSLKVEEESQVTTGNELAAAVYDMLCRIQEEPVVSS